MFWDSCPSVSCSATLLLLMSRSSGCFCQSLENVIKHISFTSLWSQKAPWCRVLGPHKRRHNQEPLKTPIWQIIKYCNSVFQLIKILKFRIFRIFPCFLYFGVVSAPPSAKKPAGNAICPKYWNSVFWCYRDDSVIIWNHCSYIRNDLATWAVQGVKEESLLGWSWGCIPIYDGLVSPIVQI